MSMMIVFILICSSFLALALRKNFISLAISGLSILLICFIGTGLLPQTLLNELQTQSHLAAPEWKSKNLIIVLGGGKQKWTDTDFYSTRYDVNSRVLEATRLYYSCKKQSSPCRVLISGGDPTREGLSEAEIMQKELIALGVAPEDLQLENKSNNTYQNAQFSEKLIHDAGFSQILLVTSGTHINRALLLFSHFGISAVPAPSDYIRTRPSWLIKSLNFALTDLALHEFGGILQFYIYNLFGLNS